MSLTNDLWIEKYRPTSLEDYYIDIDHYDKINDWLTHYINNTKEVSPFIILHGKPGIGKTTLAHLIFKKHNIEIIETNASDIRNKKQIKEIIGKIGKYKIDFCGEKTRMGIIMDELDGISSTNDKGGLSELLEIVSSYKQLQLKIKKEQCKKDNIPFDASNYIINYKNPIICTCNVLKSTKFSAMIKQSIVIRLDRCMKKNSLLFINKICKAENINITDSIKFRVYKQSFGDYRQILFQLYGIKLDLSVKKMKIVKAQTHSSNRIELYANDASNIDDSSNIDPNTIVDLDDTQKLLSSLNINDSCVQKLNFTISNQDIGSEHLHLIFGSDVQQYLLNMYSNYIYLLKVLRLSKIDMVDRSPKYNEKLSHLVSQLMINTCNENDNNSDDIGKPIPPHIQDNLNKQYNDINIDLIDIELISKLFQDTDSMIRYIYYNQNWDLFNYVSYVNMYYPCILLRKMYQLKKNKPHMYLNHHNDYNYMKQEHSLLVKSLISNNMNNKMNTDAIHNMRSSTIAENILKNSEIVNKKKRTIKEENNEHTLLNNMIYTIDPYSIYYQYQIAKKEKKEALFIKDKNIKSIFRIMDKFTKLL